MTLHDIPWTIKNIIGVISFALICGFVWNILYLRKQKNIKVEILGAAGCLCSIAVLEILCVDVHRLIQKEKSEFAISLTNINAYIFIAIVILLVLLLLLLEHINFLDRKKIISVDIVSSFADEIPVGMCYFLDGGRIILFNRCMEKICMDVTGELLLNGEVFAAAVGEEDYHICVESKTWDFVLNHKTYKERTVHELLAFDITEISAKNDELTKENEKLAALNAKLKEYYQKIDELVREQEILQAKVDIHDGMNELILRTRVSTASDNVEEMVSVMRLWERNALLLAKERNDSKDYYSDIMKLAEMLGISPVWKDDIGMVPTKLQELFAQAAKEAIANAVKHSNAMNMEISVSNSNGQTVFSFASDGDVKPEPVKFTGGLANLERIAGEHGGRIEIKQAEGFTLLLIFGQVAGAKE